MSKLILMIYSLDVMYQINEIDKMSPLPLFCYQSVNSSAYQQPGISGRNLLIERIEEPRTGPGITMTNSMPEMKRTDRGKINLGFDHTRNRPSSGILFNLAVNLMYKLLTVLRVEMLRII